MIEQWNDRTIDQLIQNIISLQMWLMAWVARINSKLFFSFDPITYGLLLTINNELISFLN